MAGSGLLYGIVIRLVVGWEHVMTQREIEDRRVVARRLYEALCAQFPDKYIALIQPHTQAEHGMSGDRIEPSAGRAGT